MFTSLKRLKLIWKYGILNLFTDNPNLDAFVEVEARIKRAGRPLSVGEKDRLRAEAITFKSSLMYRILMEMTPTEMQRIIVEECKNDDEYNYYRAIIADRKMIENMVNRLIDKEI